MNRKVGAGDAPIWNAQKKARSMPRFFLRLVARENGVFLQPQRKVEGLRRFCAVPLERRVSAILSIACTLPPPLPGLWMDQLVQQGS